MQRQQGRGRVDESWTPELSGTGICEDVGMLRHMKMLKLFGMLSCIVATHNIFAIKDCENLCADKYIECWFAGLVCPVITEVTNWPLHIRASYLELSSKQLANWNEPSFPHRECRHHRQRESRQARKFLMCRPAQLVASWQADGEDQMRTTRSARVSSIGVRLSSALSP